MFIFSFVLLRLHGPEVHRGLHTVVDEITSLRGEVLGRYHDGRHGGERDLDRLEGLLVNREETEAQAEELHDGITGDCEHPVLHARIVVIVDDVVGIRRDLRNQHDIVIRAVLHTKEAELN